MKTKAQIRYQAYLASPHWKNRRNTLLQKRGKVCELCGSTKQIQIHHQTYCRLGKELDKDLIILCSNCHSKIHQTGKLKIPQKKSTQLQHNITIEFSRKVIDEMLKTKSILEIANHFRINAKLPKINKANKARRWIKKRLQTSATVKNPIVE